MEIRNAIYRGKFTENLKKLSENKTFRILWGIPNSQDDLENNKIFAQMDDLEFTLKFFAFQEYGRFKGRLVDYLGDFMKERNDLYEKNSLLREQDEKVFIESVNAAIRIFGKDAFRKPSDSKQSVRSVPLSDAILFGCSKINIDAFNGNKIKEAKNGLVELLNDPKFASSIGHGTNGKGAIELRLTSFAKMLLTVQGKIR
jgi:hypothetical protein